MAHAAIQHPEMGQPVMRAVPGVTRPVDSPSRSPTRWSNGGLIIRPAVASTFSPFASLAMLSIDKLRSERSTPPGRFGPNFPRRP
jgi:hypothetical protein